MKNLLWVAGIFVSFLFCINAFAKDSDQGKTYIRVSPRAWFAAVDLPTEDGVSTDIFSLPMYGLTLSLIPKGAPHFTFMFTGLTGSSDTEGTVGWLSPPNNRITLGVDRSDLEFLVRYTIPDTYFSLYSGPRYITWDQNTENPALNYSTETETTIWAAELGLGTAVPVTKNGRHMFFGNFTFGLTFQDWNWKDSDGETDSDDDISPVVDFNAGYQFTLNELLSFSARYRLFTYMQATEVTDNEIKSKLVTILGPEITLSLTF